MIEIAIDPSVPKFLAHAGPLLYLDEPQNSLVIGLCEGMLRSPTTFRPVLARVLENDKTVAVAINTPPMYLILTAMKQEHLEALAQSLFEKKMQFPGVTGPARETETFAKIWSTLTGLENQLEISLKLHRLDEVVLPAPMPKGEMRLGVKSDLDFLSEWSFAFANEILPTHEIRDLAHWRERTERLIEGQLAHIWLVAGKPVTIAMGNRATTNGISISLVYTPPEFRGNGYASALVAQLSQKFLDSGKKFCLLFTDVNYPTSNKIYRAVGYKEVADSRLYLFNKA